MLTDENYMIRENLVLIFTQKEKWITKENN